jgi:hypothetical protein
MYIQKIPVADQVVEINNFFSPKAKISYRMRKPKNPERQKMSEIQVS